MKYFVTGTCRRKGAIGEGGPFCVGVTAPNDDVARDIARERLYAEGFEHVLCKVVMEGGADAEAQHPTD
jgi:hypothetical protein